MAVAYQRREIKGFPDLDVNKPWKTVHQLELLPWKDRGIHTSVTFLGRSDHPNYDKCFVEHEALRSMRVRFENSVRDRFIQILRFHLYLPRTGTRDYLYADTKARHCKELLRRLAQDQPSFKFSPRQVNLTLLRQEVEPDIRGAWFGDLQIADVRVAAIYGPTVTESDEWERYENTGEIRSLALEFTYLDTRHSILITAKGAIVLYGSYSERDALQLVENIDVIVTKFATVTAKDWKSSAQPA